MSKVSTTTAQSQSSTAGRGIPSSQNLILRPGCNSVSNGGVLPRGEADSAVPTAGKRRPVVSYDQLGFVPSPGKLIEFWRDDVFYNSSKRVALFKNLDDWETLYVEQGAVGITVEHRVAFAQSYTGALTSYGLLWAPNYLVWKSEAQLICRPNFASR